MFSFQRDIKRLNLSVAQTKGFQNIYGGKGPTAIGSCWAGWVRGLPVARSLLGFRGLTCTEDSLYSFLRRVYETSLGFQCRSLVSRPLRLFRVGGSYASSDFRRSNGARQRGGISRDACYKIAISSFGVSAKRVNTWNRVGICNVHEMTNRNVIYKYRTYRRRCTRVLVFGPRASIRMSVDVLYE